MFHKELRDEFIELQQDFNVIKSFNASALAVENFDNIQALEPFVEIDLSTEDSKANFKNNLQALNNDIINLIDKRYKKLTPIIDRSMEYNVNLLKQLKESIQNERLIPVTNINASKTLPLVTQLGVMGASGYNLKTGSGDLINYIHGLLSITKKNNLFFKQNKQMFDTLASPGVEPMKLVGFSNVIKKLHIGPSKVKRKETITDYRASIIKNWFGSSVELLTLYHSRKYGYRVSIEKFDPSTKIVIGKCSTKDAIKLLETAIDVRDKLKDSLKGLSLAVKDILKANTKQLLTGNTDNTIDGSKKFIMTKYSEGLIDVYIRMYDDLITIDDIVINYINNIFTNNVKNKTPSTTFW